MKPLLVIIAALFLCTPMFAQNDELMMLGVDLGSGFGCNFTLGSLVGNNLYASWTADVLFTAPTGYLALGPRWLATNNLILGTDLGFGDSGNDNWCLTWSALIAYNLKRISLDGIILAVRADAYFTSPVEASISLVIDIGGTYTSSSSSPAPKTKEYVYPLFEPTVSSIQEASEWVHSHIAYDHAKARNDDYYLLSPEQVLKTNGGVCRDMVVLTMKIVYDSLGIKANYVSIRIPGTPGHAILEYNGKYFDPTNLQVYTQSSIDVNEVKTYDQTMEYIGRQLK